MKRYIEQTNVEEVTDPNIVIDMYYQLDGLHIYLDEEIEKFTKLFLKQKKTNNDQGIMNNIVDKGIERLLFLDSDEQETFKVLAIKYVRIYNFLIQIYPMKNTNLYKLHIYLTGLIKKFTKDEGTSKINFDNILTLDYYRIQQIAGQGTRGEDISLGAYTVAEDLLGFTTGGFSRKRA